ncbi:hypothetical protein [Mesorhizobium sp.]|uniref:hypothetical protein n=1 Tax=Mesorhizobium sp. TaxID=1871066 RepID=UPI001219018F|nr:hypothetical protein [Mesorhizobium sp.]TIN10376.1 MAG: hypothetical protein E5Y14_10960 [Mesorhizobium sp.]
MVDLAASVFRDFVTDGVPSSGANKPRKHEVRAWGAYLESFITAFTAGGGLIYSTKAEMDADLDHAANLAAWVVDDSSDNTGIYRKVGGSGTGSWSRVADLPYSFIQAADVGAGTANAIVATTSIPLPEADARALIALNIFETNTSGTVTVAFNGEDALTIKTSSGNNPAVGGLVSGMLVAGYKSGSTFRLLSDQASAAIQSASEAAKIAAEAARDLAAGYATDALTGGMDPGISTVSGLGSIEIPVGVAAFSIRGYGAVDDLKGWPLAVEVDNTGAAEPGEADDANGRRFKVLTRDPNPYMFGAAGNGTTNDYAAVNACFAAAIASGGKVIVPPGNFRCGTALTPPAGLVIEGFGKSSIISTNAVAQLIQADSIDNVVLRNLKLTPHNSGTNRAAIFADTCKNWSVENVWVEGQTDANGIWLIDCDDCVVDRLHYDGSASLNGYAGYIAGGKGCKIINSVAYRPQFGFVIVGSDIQPLSGRSSEECFGNIIAGCRVHGHEGHAFDINAAHGNVIAYCAAEDYGGVSTNVAFQIKDSVSGGARQNMVVGCVAKGVPNGFGGQAFGNAIFEACTATEISGSAFFFNGGRRSQIKNCVARNFDTAAVRLSAVSTNNIVDGLLIDTDNALAKGILIDGGGSSANQFDHVQIVSTLAAAIDIITGCSDNRFGMGFNANQMPIVDAAGNSAWPIRIWTPEISVASTGNTHGPQAPRGMQVARTRFVVTTTISGSPQAQCGSVGANTSVAAAQAISGSAGTASALTLASTPTIATAGVFQGRIGTAGASGNGFFQVEGLPLQ